MDHIGIDVHKRDTQICIIDAEGKVLLERRVRTTREALTAALGERARKGRVVVESSGESEWVARHLESLGCVVIVADPNFQPMYAHRNRHVKTDRRDARTLADASRFEVYRVAHRKSDEQRHVAAQLSVRDVLVKTRAKFVVLAQALVRRTGLRVKPGSAEKFLDRLAALDLPADIAAELAPITAVLPTLNAQIDAADAAIEAIVRRDERLSRLKTVPGVGPITAAAFLSVIDTASRFANARQVQAYLGLVPREYSSGEKMRRGSITKAGQSQMRSLLVQTALRIQRMTTQRAAPLRDWSRAIAARRGRKIAIVALARKTAAILFAILRDGNDFRVPKPPPSTCELLVATPSHAPA